MTNMELRRKVGYRPRKRAAGRAATRHSARRSYAAFLALGEDACAAAWEMDTVEGAREDSACLLTLLHRPSRLQLALPLGGKTAGRVAAALEGVRAVLGADGTRRVFRAVLTDNGAEFADEGAVAALLGEGPGETRLFYCDPGRSDQKGACERNHVEIRKPTSLSTIRPIKTMAQPASSSSLGGAMTSAISPFTSPRARSSSASC